METVTTADLAIEVRLARLAFMPADADAAIARMKNQIRGIWLALGAAAPPLLAQGLRASAPHVPGLWNCRPHDLDEVLLLLDRILPNHHPEEIRVASFALLCGLVELVHEELGSDHVGAMLSALERTAA